jgi:CheY-like chemotaxis protein
MAANKQLNVLIVEDNHDAADSLAQCLLLHGYHSKIAYVPKEAGEHVQQGFRPEVILMDLGLPEMDGFRLARELCDELPNRPLLVAITGHCQTAQRAIREGFDLHFLKPVDPAQLVDILDAHLDRLRHNNCNSHARPSDGVLDNASGS